MTCTQPLDLRAPDGTREHRLAHGHRVPVAPERVDLPVVGQQPERLRQRPARQGVGRVALVEDGDGALVLRVAEVGVEGRELGAGEERLVDDGAAGEGAGVEAGQISRLPLVAPSPAVPGRGRAPRRPRRPPSAGRPTRTCRITGQEARAVGPRAAGIHRHVAPAEERDAVARQHLLDHAHRGAEGLGLGGAGRTRPRRRAARAAGGAPGGTRRGRKAARGSGSAGPRRRPSCRSTPRPGAPPGRRPRAPWRRPRASARRTRVATKPTPQASCSRDGSRDWFRRHGGVRMGAGRDRCGNRPGGSAAHWRPWCLLNCGAPSAGEAGCGANKRPAPHWERAGAQSRRRADSTRSLPWSGRVLRMTKDRGVAQLHERIIMHARCNPSSGDLRLSTGDKTCCARILGLRYDTSLRSETAPTPLTAIRPRVAFRRWSKLQTSGRTPTQSRPPCRSTSSLVVVLLGLLLTSLIGEPGVRGVPKRAA